MSPDDRLESLSDDELDRLEAASAHSGSRVRFVLGAAVLGLLLFFGGFVLGFIPGSADADPGEGSAEVGFARDMQVHHAQAVEMALIVRDRTDDEYVDTIAYDIATTQQQQAGQMYGWLTVWDVPQAPQQARMAWMNLPTLDGDTGGHEHEGESFSLEEGGLMPGMATSAQLDALRAASGVEAERLFLELMIPHHEAGIEMGEAITARSDNPVVLRFAEGMIAAQQAEIGNMQRALDARR